jgi:hypothetical protein
MYTITLGVDENYSSENFYSADKDFEAEKSRIREKFDNADKLGRFNAKHQPKAQVYLFISCS